MSISRVSINYWNTKIKYISNFINFSSLAMFCTFGFYIFRIYSMQKLFVVRKREAILTYTTYLCPPRDLRYPCPGSRLSWCNLIFLKDSPSLPACSTHLPAVCNKRERLELNILSKFHDNASGMEVWERIAHGSVRRHDKNSRWFSKNSISNISIYNNLKTKKKILDNISEIKCRIYFLRD